MKKPPKSKPAKAKSAPIPLTLEQLYEAHERNLKGAPTALTPHTYREAIRLYAHGVPETMIGPSLKPALGRTAVKDWLDKGDADAAKGLISIRTAARGCEPRLYRRRPREGLARRCLDAGARQGNAGQVRQDHPHRGLLQSGAGCDDKR